MARSRRPRAPEASLGGDRWLTTYGDMVTLLLAFFVMLFAVSETDNQKFEAFIAGLAGPFNNQTLTEGLLDGAELGQGAANPLEMIAPGAAGVWGAEVDEATSGQETSEGAEGESTLDEQLQQVRSRLAAAIDALPMPVAAEFREDERGLILALATDDVLFATGSAAISPDGREIIAAIAPVLADIPNTVVIEGHTDTQPLDRGGYTNWNLSTDRAVAVLELLGEAHGVPFTRLAATGYGEHRPVAPNDTAAGMARNRRVEVLVVSTTVAGADTQSAPPAAAGVEPAPEAGSITPDLGPDLAPSS